MITTVHLPYEYYLDVSVEYLRFCLFFVFSFLNTVENGIKCFDRVRPEALPA